MSSHTYDYLDGNPAAGDLSSIFAIDVTDAEAQMRALRRNQALRRGTCVQAKPRFSGAMCSV